MSAFLLADFGDAGVLLDLHSGDYFSVRGAALAPGRAVLDDAAHAQPAPLGRSDAAPSGRQSVNPVRFSRRRGSFVMLVNGVEAVHVRPRPRTIALPPHHGRSAATIAPTLQLAAPHLLALLGRPLLHASAVATPTGVAAFVGPTGAGKSTLARILEELGQPAVSGDLLLARAGRSGLSVAIRAEQAVQGWATQAAQAFLSGVEEVDFGALSSAGDGPREPLSRLFVLPAAERRERELRVRRLSHVQAFAGLLANSFAELGTPAVWRDLFKLCERTVKLSLVAELQTPAGLRPLRAGLRTALAAGELLTSG